MKRWRESKVPWALVLVSLAALAATGHGLAWAQAARNETATSANGDTLDALLSTTSRAFSKSECVESIRIMKSTFSRFRDWSPTIEGAFPADDTFIPPGADAWCNCLQDNEPADGIPSDYEGVFDTCRDQVLVNSDYNAADICRGMMRLYGYNMWNFYRTFCARELCRPRDEFRSSRDDNFWHGSGFDLHMGCLDECMAELSAGYCAKYRVTYGGWVSGSHYSFGGSRWRSVVVDSKRGFVQTSSSWRGRLGFPFWSDKVSDAKRMCDWLYPTDQGRCCSYERGYATLRQCCYLKNGALEFNCDKSYGGARLLYNCAKKGIEPPTDICSGCDSSGTACTTLIDAYVAHPTYQQATLARLPDGQTSVVFPEEFIDDFCASREFSELSFYSEYNYDYPYAEGTREWCCHLMNQVFGVFVENCQPGAGTHPSLGPARLPPSVAGPPPTPGPQPTPGPKPTPDPQPTPSPSPPSPPVSCDPCSFMNSKGKCKSVCKSTEQCTVRNGKAFCVRCNYFRQDFADGKNRQCCELRDGTSGALCKTKVNNKGAKNKCFTNEGPWTNNKGKKRKPQPYTVDAVQNVCNARENFWVNRKLCKVKDTANGRKECKYISEKERKRILAGR